MLLVGGCQHHKQVFCSTVCISGCSLVSSDDGGAVCLWEAASASSYTQRHALMGHGTPCVALAVRGETVVAAFQDGVVRLHDMVRCGPLSGLLLCGPGTVGGDSNCTIPGLGSQAAQDVSCDSKHTLRSGCAWGGSGV